MHLVKAKATDGSAGSAQPTSGSTETSATTQPNPGANPFGAMGGMPGMGGMGGMPGMGGMFGGMGGMPGMGGMGGMGGMDMGMGQGPTMEQL